MKTRLYVALIAIVCFVIVAANKSQAQTAPIFSFNSWSLETGTALTAGAVYRFANVSSGVDALVTISTITSGITLRNIDRTIDGYSEAFQPEYRVNGSTNGYIEFQIRFVNGGGNTTSPRPLVSATGLDIAPFSNTRATVAAPGVGVLSAKTGGGLRSLNGTSMATPHAAGIAALWAEKLAINGRLNPQTLQARLIGTASFDTLVDSIDPLDVGSGLVRAPQA